MLSAHLFTHLPYSLTLNENAARSVKRQLTEDMQPRLPLAVPVTPRYSQRIVI
jgi:hypothetical protein